MVKTLEDHGGKIDSSKNTHKRTDEDRKRDFDNCKVDGGDDDDVPMYLLNADGSVKVLHPRSDSRELLRPDRQDLKERRRTPCLYERIGKMPQSPRAPMRKVELY
ncbi:hypothetical protein ACIQWZ_09550 [Streptomyces sp. NPDC098077]|uniref:hypothetical protein n=1 Tax=Streptomyces sp. NPDC098077 TaxID=3366093 RepID=UPI0037FD347A